MEMFAGTTVLLGGLLGGILLGFASRWGRFCTLGALEDGCYGHDFRRLRAWALAMAMGMAITHGAWWAGLVPMEESFVLSSAFSPLGLVVGGIIFGFGMALTGTCPFGVLARVGGGDLRSVIVLLVIAVAGYATMVGILSPLRIAIFEPWTLVLGEAGTQHMGLLASEILGLPVAVPLVLGAIAGLLWWALRDGEFRRTPRYWISGLLVGLAIGSGFVVTGMVAQHAFEIIPIKSHTFVAPTGRALMFAMTRSADGVDFGVAALVGVILGAWATTLARRTFRWEACDDARELGRHMTGGALMGVGGVLAVGCSVGQGLTAASAFALSSPVAILAMALGARAGLGFLVEGRLFPTLTGRFKF